MLRALVVWARSKIFYFVSKFGLMFKYKLGVKRAFSALTYFLRYHAAKAFGAAEAFWE